MSAIIRVALILPTVFAVVIAIWLGVIYGTDAEPAWPGLAWTAIVAFVYSYILAIVLLMMVRRGV